MNGLFESLVTSNLQQEQKNKIAFPKSEFKSKPKPKSCFN